jgi:hypothetical protein
MFFATSAPALICMPAILIVSVQGAGGLGAPVRCCGAL